MGFDGEHQRLVESLAPRSLQVMELNLEDPATAVLVGIAALIVLALVLRLFGLAVKAVVTVVLLVGVVFAVLYATDSLPGG